MEPGTKFSIDDRPPTTVKRAPGRPKGSTNKPRATASATDAATLKQALASLDSLYDFTTLGLTMFGFAETASEWVTAAESLRATNEDALKASPRLAQAIARAGSVGGATTFFIAHAVALGGVMRSAQAELRARNVATEPKTSDDPTVIPFPGA